MGKTLSQKIIAKHLVHGEMLPGKEIAIKVDQTLTQDATGTMAYLEFATLGIPSVKTELSVCYVDHNTLQVGFENADDHKFLQSVATKYGIYFSHIGNGICHQVHLERFGIPGKTLLGSDSHTPTCGGLGMLSIGAGGLDVASALAGYPFYFKMPYVINVRLHGKPAPWTSAKDIILEVLRKMTVKGCVGKILEYTGDGISYLSVPERSTITNMGAETGATSSIFPSDNITKKFFTAQNRDNDFIELQPDSDATYDEIIDIYLDQLAPLIALPSMPDNVVDISQVIGQKIDQVFIGSCTNSSYTDLMRVACILKGKTVHPKVSLVIAPGSRQVLHNLTINGALSDIINAGARILECTCGPCAGIGQAPGSNGISLRTSNRNFEGRSGTNSGKVFLSSCEVAAVSALAGEISDPRKFGDPIVINAPERFFINDNMIDPPIINTSQKLFMGPNIKDVPLTAPLKNNLINIVLLKLEDNISTDHIMPAGAKIMAFRSNIPAISQYAFSRIDPTFPKRALSAKGGIIVGGLNYGQGSSREHAVLAPLYLGIKVVIAKSFSRIHMQNLVNFGILPLIFSNENDYDNISINDKLSINNLITKLPINDIKIQNLSTSKTYMVHHSLSNRQIKILLAGGLLNYIKSKNNL